MDAEIEEDLHLSQQAEELQRSQASQTEDAWSGQEERDRLEADAYDQGCASETAARIVQQQADAAAATTAEEAELVQAQANAEVLLQAANATAQVGQFEQFMEAHRQQNLPPGRKAYQEPVASHSLGAMDVQCWHCQALHLDAEKLAAFTHNNKKFGQCCLQGRINLRGPISNKRLHLYTK
jgi:hypothetical protein